MSSPKQELVARTANTCLSGFPPSNLDGWLLDKFDNLAGNPFFYAVFKDR